MTLPAGTPIGKYVVRRKIAEGGMAEIYLAKAQGPEGFEKDVVIKRIRAFLADDPGFVQMFIAEARLASKLNHANLVQIFDFDTHEDSYYLAMEYVRGPSLWDVRKKSKERMEPMPPTLVAQVCAEVARGLHYAHRLTDKGKPLQLVHRDVTPHNVLLSFDGAVKLTDFGVAKAGNSKTAAGVLKGKFAYMAPEQARGDAVDARTDVFALGIVLWEMLTGGRLFDGDSDLAVLRAVQQSQIAPPVRVNPEISPELDAVVMKALERDPAQRFQTAQELERALAQYVMGAAKSLEDKDLSAFLRRLFQEEGSGAGEPHHDGTISGPGLEAAPAEPSRPRVATAVMRPGGQPPRLGADDDLHAPTHVVDRSSEPRAATPPQGTPAQATPGSLAPSKATPAGAGATAVLRPPQQVASARGLRPATAAVAGVALLFMGGAVTYAITRSGRLEAGSPVVGPASPVVGAGQVAAPPGQSLQSPALASPGAVPPAEGSRPAATERSSAGPTEAAPGVTPGSGRPPANAPAAASVRGAGPPVPGPVAGSTPAAPAPAELATGVLVLKVTPWAMVSIDGKRAVEVSSKGTFKLPAGSHHLRLEHNREVREKDVVVEDGKRVQREFSFLAAH